MSAADGAPVSVGELGSLFNFLDQYPFLILAVSGGPDSTALMVLAARWRKALKRGPALMAVTIDHGLRPEAKKEALAVKQLARSLRIEHRTLRWTGPKPKTGIQEAARAARYRLLAGLSRKVGGAPVLTGHTLDDQAETVLFRMMRGSGVSGLVGIKAGNLMPGYENDRIELLRPLLNLPKSRLVATLKAARIGYADDPSNQDPRFARPRLRRLMPLLAAEGLTAERLGRMAWRVGRAEIALYETLQATLQRLAPGPWPDKGPVKFDADEFDSLPEEMALRMLERVINWVGNEGPVELGKLEALHDELAASSGGARFRRTLAGAIVTRSKDRLTVERAPARRSGGASNWP